MSYFSDLPAQLFTPPTGPLPGIIFRRAHRTDLNALYLACYSDRPKAQFRDAFLRSLTAQTAGNRIHLVVEAKGMLVGNGQLLGYTHKAEIADLVVAAPRRKQGIGTALIGIFVQMAQFAGFERIEIGVMAENRGALALYRRLGFEPAREIPLAGEARAIILQMILRQ